MARLDTGWHEHPKILALGLAGMGLHAWSISYCDATLSDGFIPNGAWPALRGMRQTVQKLVRSGVWIPVESGYVVHDYGNYNRSRAHVESVRAAMRANGQAGGRASARAKAQANSNQTTKQTRQQKPTPGPGPGLSPFLGSSSSSPEHARAPARENPDPQLLAEHLRRVEQERQTAAAAPAYVNFSDETLA